MADTDPHQAAAPAAAARGTAQPGGSGADTTERAPRPVPGFPGGALRTGVRLIAPLLLFAVFFDPSILDPTRIGWLLEGDLAQHFLGWTAFRFDAWRWPLGMTELLAHPIGAPISLTDSNPLAAIPLKLFAPVLSDPFQFLGLWYCASLLLAYNIVYDLLSRISGRPWPSLIGAALVAGAPVFFSRLSHDTLTSQWLLLGALWVFFRVGSDTSARVAYAGTLAAAVAIHPYFLPMTLAIAGSDLVRRAWRRRSQGASALASIGRLTAGIAGLLAPAVAVAWAIGLFALAGVGTLPAGHFSMDPLAWFNAMGDSAVLEGWTTGPGQYEGHQYLGLGGLALVLGAGVLWLGGRARPPTVVARGLPWLLPALAGLYLFALSPVVTAFGHPVLAIDVVDWPVLGAAFGTFRSSGRMGWPITYVALTVGVFTWLSIGSRAASGVLAALLAIQLADLRPLARATRAATAPRPERLAGFLEESPWRPLVAAAQRVHLSADVPQEVFYRIGVLAFPQARPLSRFYLAQGLSARGQVAHAEAADRRVLAGDLSDEVLYVLDPGVVGAWLARGEPAAERLVVLGGVFVVPPMGATAAVGQRLRFAPGPPPGTLLELVDGCGAGCALTLAVADLASAELSREFIAGMERRGGRIGELGQRGSYAAILVDGRVVADGVALDADVRVAASVYGRGVRVESGGRAASDRALVAIDGVSLSLRRRGVNALRMTPEGVSAIACYDDDRGAVARPGPGRRQ